MNTPEIPPAESDFENELDFQQALLRYVADHPGYLKTPAFGNNLRRLQDLWRSNIGLAASGEDPPQPASTMKNPAETSPESPLHGINESPKLIQTS